MQEVLDVARVAVQLDDAVDESAPEDYDSSGLHPVLAPFHVVVMAEGSSDELLEPGVQPREPAVVGRL